MLSRTRRRFRQRISLSELALRNFKAFGDETQKVPLSRITLIYGPNSGGKSSVIQSLLLLKQSEGNLPRGGVLAPQGEYVDLAGFKAMVHRHQEERDLEINIVCREDDDQTLSVDMTFGNDDRHGTDLPTLRRVAYDFAESIGRDLCVALTTDGFHTALSEDTPIFGWHDREQATKSLAQYIRGLFASPQPRGGYPTWLLRDRYPDLSAMIRERDGLTSDMLETLGNLRFQATSSILPINPTLNRRVSVTESNEFERFLSRNLVGMDMISRQFQELLNSISYVGPVLDDPRRFYLTWGGRRSTVGKRGEYTFDIVAFDEQVRRQVNAWFDRFGISYELKGDHPVAASELTGTLSTMALEDHRTGTTVTPVDVGFGISQILPVIVEGVAGRAGIVCVDQPEVHLHPKLQAEIADLMIECTDKQWIVETHSELLVRRLLRRVAEPSSSFHAGDVSVVYVDPSKPNESTTGSVIKVLNVEPTGQLSAATPWPDGFFEDGYSEMMATIRAGV